jgi:hypothetical protein
LGDYDSRLREYLMQLIAWKSAAHGRAPYRPEINTNSCSISILRRIPDRNILLCDDDLCVTYSFAALHVEFPIQEYVCNGAGFVAISIFCFVFRARSFGFSIEARLANGEEYDWPSELIGHEDLIIRERNMAVRQANIQWSP